MKKVILTGDRPTGRLHVGHYAGSLKERVKLQNSGEYDDIYLMIADAQALTDNAEHPEKVRQNILQVALDYLACGIDPNKSTIFVQSMIPELTELTFYYMNLVTVSRVQRNPTVKAEIQMRNFEASIPVGFFCYPISQAADITAFRATAVPVGEDQLPMLEQCKEIVHKFNSVYGETLTEPQIILPSNKACLRLPGIDGKAKMSKSLGNCIYLAEEPEDIKKKVMSMFTDPNHLRVEDPARLRAIPCLSILTHSAVTSILLNFGMITAVLTNSRLIISVADSVMSRLRNSLTMLCRRSFVLFVNAEKNGKIIFPMFSIFSKRAVRLQRKLPQKHLRMSVIL